MLEISRFGVGEDSCGQLVSFKILGLLLVWNVDSCLGYFCLFECLICLVCVLMIARFSISKLDLILCF